jgi:hypothetical protein
MVMVVTMASCRRNIWTNKQSLHSIDISKAVLKKGKMMNAGSSIASIHVRLL